LLPTSVKFVKAINFLLAFSLGWEWQLGIAINKFAEFSAFASIQPMMHSLPPGIHTQAFSEQTQIDCEALHPNSCCSDF
jgi:hypothetical protein